ncbi:MAG: FMN-binding negative transcriptional regulator [Ferruginibacter sp.]|nr:FMN-binding negative transcriptional regulator [Chitinophagaceae bacterium]MBP6286195.1 FMN-binding negative transcriptional regulator [Ferruginibacter sp.]MBU9935211.1 FMN-binding negative transcriptional regulator [Ferruginibacter sp.]
MYKFDYYTEKDRQKVIDFMKENAFALVTGIGEEYPAATQVPLAIKEKEGKIFLEGHIMRKTDHHLAFEKNNNVLVIFTGPHCFVSANWYTDPHMGSTWNYMTVQAKGNIRFMDAEGTYNAVKEVSDKYVGTQSAGAFDNLPKEYIDHMMKAIVGFSIEVESLENTFKLSQNRDEASQRNIIEQLVKRGDEHSRKIAKEMIRRLD